MKEILWNFLFNKYFEEDFVYNLSSLEQIRSDKEIYTTSLERIFQLIQLIQREMEF